MKAEMLCILRLYVISREIYELTVLRMMPHVTQCIFDELIGYFAGGPQEKCYRLFTAMMNIVAYVPLPSLFVKALLRTLLGLTCFIL